MRRSSCPPKRPALLRVLALVVAALLSVSPGHLAAASPAQQAQEAQQAGNFPAASRAWEQAAAANPAARGEFLLAAAETAFWGGDDARAETLLSRMPLASFDAAQLERASMLRADIALMRHLPYGALQALPPQASVPRFAPRMEALRARALFALGDPIAGTRSLLVRERYVGGDADALRQNRDWLWDLLLKTPLPAALQAELSSQETQTRGWLEAAEAAGSGHAAALDAWRRRYAGHPAASYLPPVLATSSATEAQAPSEAPRQLSASVGFSGAYALLLPLSGPLASVGEALRDGFVAAYLESGGGQPPLRIYDSGGTADGARAALARAVNDGAAFVVGPLQKEEVAAVAAPPRPLPVLALNRLEREPGGQGLYAPLYQLGLAPEDEARAAAERALTDGHARAVALVPDSDWGRRVLASFEARYNEGGGRLLGVERYASGEMNFGPAMGRLVNLSGSEGRHRALAAALGEDAEFEPRRRNDIDALFAPARPAELALIEPQLRFYHAGELPTYGLAVSYEPGRVLPLHLIACDMPWMLDAAGGWSVSVQQSQILFGDAVRRNPRLYALGQDAYRLAQTLRGTPGAAAGPIRGATGTLRLEPDGHFVRSLGCADVSGGTPGPVRHAEQSH